LPSAALGKAFDECIYGFAECSGHLAKRLIPVVAAEKRYRGPPAPPVMKGVVHVLSLRRK
jgi:hypothetical protein